MDGGVQQIQLSVCSKYIWRCAEIYSWRCAANIVGSVQEYIVIGADNTVGGVQNNI
jgi:hypothetical protein